MMKKIPLILICSLYVGLSFSQTDSTVWKRNASNAAAKMHLAFTSKNWEDFAKTNHPKVVSMLGGYEGFVSTIKNQMNEMEETIKIDSFQFGEPYQFYKGDSLIHCLLPQKMVMRATDSSFIIHSTVYLLGVSDDDGTTWYFLDTANGGLFLDAIEPRRDKKYEIPNKKQSFSYPKKD